MKFEGVAQREIGRPAIELGAIIENARLRHVVAIASGERGSGVGAASASHLACYGVNSARIGDHWRDTTKAVGGKAVVAANRTRTKVGVERVVVLRYVGVAASQCKTATHALLKGKNAAVIFSGIPGAKAIHKGNCGVVVDARSKG